MAAAPMAADAESENDACRLDLPNRNPVENDLGDGDDTVIVDEGANVDQVRLTFTSGEVGNGEAEDSDTLASQDGGLAVRVRAESMSGVPRGPVSRMGNVSTTAAGANTLVNVDANADGTADFNITLVNATAPASGDVLFA